VRDYAIVSLLAVYGMRAGEVIKLRLSDLDWKRDQLLVPRVKRRAPQRYPLVATVGNRLTRYIQEVRPRCPRPEVFLGLRAPHRPLTQGALYALLSSLGRFPRPGPRRNRTWRFPPSGSSAGMSCGCIRLILSRSTLRCVPWVEADPQEDPDISPK
jgi:integrase